MALTLKIRIEGIREILRAFNKLPAEAQNIVRDRSLELAQDLARIIQAAGRADSRQSAVAAKSVVAKRDRVPVVSAGSRGGRKARDLLFGSEFGMNRKTGWYRKVRYFDSPALQFRPHRGANSYWFFRTAEREDERVGRAYTAMADEIIQQWARG